MTNSTSLGRKSNMIIAFEASEFSCILHVDGSCDKYHVHVPPKVINLQKHFRLTPNTFMFTLIKDAVRKTYNELQKGREDFTGFLTDARLVTLSF